MEWKRLGVGTGAVVAADTAVGADSEGPGGGPLSILFYPFRALAFTLIEMFVRVLMDTATIYPNPAIETIHRLTLMVAVVLAVLVAMAAGLYLLIGEEIGIPYRETRRILPRLVLALGFALIALPVLQIGVGFAEALVEAFRPRSLVSVEQLAGLTSSLALVWFINAWVLLALVLLMVIRNFYLAFVAAVSPLIAVAWSFSSTKPYAESFISLWFVLLITAPADVLVLRFALTMMEASGAFGLQTVSNWILGTASFTMMLWIPYQLYGVSQAVVGGQSIASSTRQSWRRRRPPRGGSGGGDDELPRNPDRRGR